MKKLALLVISILLSLAMVACGSKSASNLEVDSDVYKESISIDEFMNYESDEEESTESETTYKETAITEETKSTQSKIKYKLYINLSTQVVTAVQADSNGEFTVPVRNMICSTGAGGATPKGSFKISNKYRWHVLKGNVWGQWCSRINGPILFHSVPYYKRDASTLKTSSYNRLGTPASAGCIRLRAIDAKWIYDNCPSGTQVEVGNFNYSFLPGKMSTQKINSNVTWDPTDPDSNNPYKGNDRAYVATTQATTAQTTTEQTTTTNQTTTVQTTKQTTKETTKQTTNQTTTTKPTTSQSTTKATDSTSTNVVTP